MTEILTKPLLLPGQTKAPRTKAPQPGDVVPSTALICDDHPAFAKGLAALLEQVAPDLVVAGIARSGEEAESMVRDLLPDVVLMDIRMPTILGITQGETNREIGRLLHVSERTERRRAQDAKLHLAHRLEAAIYAVQKGLVPEQREQGVSR